MAIQYPEIQKHGLLALSPTRSSNTSPVKSTTPSMTPLVRPSLRGRFGRGNPALEIQRHGLPRSARNDDPCELVITRSQALRGRQALRGSLRRTCRALHEQSMPFEVCPGVFRRAGMWPGLWPCSVIEFAGYLPGWELFSAWRGDKKQSFGVVSGRKTARKKGLQRTAIPLISWCRREDSNLHRGTPTRP